MVRIGILLCLLGLPGPIWAQSTLSFPKIFSISELKTTGFAVVNPGPVDATVRFTLYKPDSPTSQILWQTSWLVPAKAQLSKLGSELFPSFNGYFVGEPTGNPFFAVPGWVQVTSTTPGLQGFWIGGDFATFTDGAGPSPAGGDLVQP